MVRYQKDLLVSEFFATRSDPSSSSLMSSRLRALSSLQEGSLDRPAVTGTS